MTCVRVGRGVVPVIGLDHEDAGELAVGAGGGLQAGPVHAGDREQALLQLVHELEHALHVLLGLVGVEFGEAGQGRHLVVHLGVVLHGARPERIEAGVDAVVEMRQAECSAAPPATRPTAGGAGGTLPQPHAGQQVGQRVRRGRRPPAGRRRDVPRRSARRSAVPDVAGLTSLLRRAPRPGLRRLAPGRAATRTPAAASTYTSSAAGEFTSVTATSRASSTRLPLPRRAGPPSALATAWRAARPGRLRAPAWPSGTPPPGRAAAGRTR